MVALLALIVLGNALSPFFLTTGNFGNLIAALMEVAIMALPMTLIIIAGEIDLSVESMAGLSSAILGFLWAAGYPMEIAIVVVLVVGVAGRPLERPARRPWRTAVARRHPRHAGALPWPRPHHPRAPGVSDFPPGFTEIGFGKVPGTDIPWPFVIFLRSH